MWPINNHNNIDKAALIRKLLWTIFTFMFLCRESQSRVGSSVTEPLFPNILSRGHCQTPWRSFLFMLLYTASLDHSFSWKSTKIHNVELTKQKLTKFIRKKEIFQSQLQSQTYFFDSKISYSLFLLWPFLVTVGMTLHLSYILGLQYEL